MTESSASSGPPDGAPTCYRHPGREAYIRCQRCGRSICPDCMRDAAVGFQCPDCLKQGARSMRQGRTAYGGKRSADVRLTTVVLIGINVALWLLVLVRQSLQDRLMLLPTGLCESVSDAHSVYGGVTEQQCGRIPDGDWYSGVSDGAYWQLVTSAFLHVAVLHIAANMLLLFFLGPQLEASLGRVRFLVLYLVAGLAGSVSVYWFSAADSRTLGASGAVLGLVAGLGVVSYKVNGNLQSVAGLLVLALVSTLFVRDVSWQGHLGGFVGGAVVTGILVYAPKVRRTQWQTAGVALVVLVLVAATLARTAALA